MSFGKQAHAQQPAPGEHIIMRAPPVDLEKLEAVRYGPRRHLPYDGSEHELTPLGLVPWPQQRFDRTLRLEEHLQCLDYDYKRPWEAAGKGSPVNEIETNDGDLGCTPRCMRKSRWAVGLTFLVVVGVFVGLGLYSAFFAMLIKR